MQWVEFIQWPAMVVTVIASWCVGATQRRQREWGFWLFLLSNVLWIAWGWNEHAYALVILQLCLIVMNVHGAKKNET